MLLIDLDGFKLVNDAYGHPAGDTFLEHVARHLKAAIASRVVEAGRPFGWLVIKALCRPSA